MWHDGSWRMEGELASNFIPRRDLTARGPIARASYLLGLKCFRTSLRLASLFFAFLRSSLAIRIFALAMSSSLIPVPPVSAYDWRSLWLYSILSGPACSAHLKSRFPLQFDAGAARLAPPFLVLCVCCRGWFGARNICFSVLLPCGLRCSFANKRWALFSPSSASARRCCVSVRCLFSALLLRASAERAIVDLHCKEL